MLLRHALARSRVGVPHLGIALRRCQGTIAADLGFPSHSSSLSAGRQDILSWHPRPVLRCARQPRAHPRGISHGCSGAVRGLAVQIPGAASSSAPPPPQDNRLRKGLVLLAKSAVIWIPALFFWASMVLGDLFDLRTDEEINADENEVRRLERFFDVEGLSEAEYMTEWTAKEQALSQIMEKFLRSQKFTAIIARGPDEDVGDDEETEHQPKPAAWSKSSSTATPNVANISAEVSYVLPPPAEEDEVGGSDNQPEKVGGHGGAGRSVWGPRLIVAHGDCALALVTLRFEYVVKGKDREERWACTTLRADLIATHNGDSVSEQIFDLHGPVPHGVRYMRL